MTDKLIPANEPKIPKMYMDFLSILDECGDIERACKEAKVTVNMVRRYKKKSPEFEAGWELAMERHNKFKNYGCFLDVYAKTGNMTEASRLSGLKRTDVIIRKGEDPAFAELLDEARIVAVDGLEKEARRRAVEGVHKPLVHGGRLVYQVDAAGQYITDELGALIPITVTEYSDRLLELLLKAHAPEKYRENMKVDHVVTGGVMMLTAPQSESEWEKKMERKRLQMASEKAKVIEHESTSS